MASDSWSDLNKHSYSFIVDLAGNAYPLTVAGALLVSIIANLDFSKSDTIAKLDKFSGTRCEVIVRTQQRNRGMPGQMQGRKLKKTQMKAKSVRKNTPEVALRLKNLINGLSSMAEILNR